MPLRSSGRQSEPARHDALTQQEAVTAVVIVIATAVGVLSKSDVIRVCAGVGLPVLLITGMLRGRLVAWIGATVTLTAVLIALWRGRDAFELLSIGSSRAALLMSVVISLSYMKGPASRSRTLVDAGLAIVRQPPQRRALTLLIGSHLMAVVLHLAALSLMGTMLRNHESRPYHTEEKQLTGDLLAILRGFSVMTCWSPTSIIVALLITTQPGLSYPMLFPVGAAVAAVLLLCGLIVRRFGEPVLPTSPANIDQPRLRLSRVFGLCIALMSGIFGTGLLLGIETIEALVVAAPVISFVWALKHRIDEKQQVKAIPYPREINFVPPLRETSIMGTIGAVSVIVTGLLDSGMLGLSQMHPWMSILLPELVLFFLVFSSRIGMPPAVSLIAISAMIGDILGGGAPSSALLVAMLGGVALGAQFSWVATNILVLGNVTATPERELVAWNTPYVLLSASVLAAIIAYLTVNGATHTAALVWSENGLA